MTLYGVQRALKSLQSYFSFSKNFTEHLSVGLCASFIDIYFNGKNFYIPFLRRDHLSVQAEHESSSPACDN